MQIYPTIRVTYKKRRRTKGCMFRSLRGQDTQATMLQSLGGVLLVTSPTPQNVSTKPSVTGAARPPRKHVLKQGHPETLNPKP